MTFDCPLRKEAVRDCWDGTRIARIRQGAKCQVTEANTTKHAVDVNAETDRCLSSPQDPVTGEHTGGAECNTYGLLRCTNTWGNRHGVLEQST
jgi:hypothetical protein